MIVVLFSVYTSSIPSDEYHGSMQSNHNHKQPTSTDWHHFSRDTSIIYTRFVSEQVNDVSKCHIESK